MSETFEFLRPLTSPLFALLVTLALPVLLRRKPGIRTLAVWLGGITVGWFLLYLLMEQVPALERLLTPLNTPLATVWLVVVLPAMLLPRNSYYRYFLIIQIGRAHV